MLLNKTHYATLQKEGFVTFPFLSDKDVHQLYKVFEKYDASHAANGRFHHSTFHIGDKQIAEQVDADIQAIIKESVDKHFYDYSFFVGNFMVKESDVQSELPPHQDWTYVDESQYWSANIWIPLQDVDTNNGCLTFLPRSHSIYHSHRPSPFYPGIFDNVMHLAKKNMIPVPMKAGEAVVFYHSVLHGSTANSTNQRRLNIAQGIYAQKAQLLHLFIEKETEIISQYNISLNDFYKLGELQRPTHIKSVREFKPTFPQLTEKQFLEYYPTSVFQRMKCWIKEKTVY